MHLSDIHFGQERDGGTHAINEDAKARLIDDASAEVAKLGGRATGVIVTGDIAYSGKREEYQTAANWLGKLTDAIGCKRVDVQMIPGNHDIDRDKISTTIECILFTIREKGADHLDRFLDDPIDRDVLYGRFEAYRDFAYEYESELDLAGGISNGGRLELAAGRSIRFVRLNSALICSRRDDEGKLILGKRQQPLPVQDGEEVVVLVHHPLNWFQDSAAARKYLRARARVLISGHEHHPKLVIDHVEDGCDLMLLAAGATNPDKVEGVYTYKYNVLVFAWDEKTDALAVTINPRTWLEETKRFGRDDAFMEGKTARQLLASPNFRKAPKPAVRGSEIDACEEPRVVKPVETAPIAVQSLVVKTDAGDQEAAHPPETDPTLDERLLQLRFFKEFAEGERLNALVELGAVPFDLAGRLDHAMERRLFRMLVRGGSAGFIEQKLAEAKARKDAAAG